MKEKRLWLAFGLLFAGEIALSLFVGKYPLRWSAVFEAGSMDCAVFWKLRVGRTLAAALSGIALAVAGHVFQIVFRNPLASPDVIGTASGAGVGAAAAILIRGYSPVLTSAGAFLGAAAAAALVLALSGLVREKSVLTVVLTGIAVNAVFQGLLMLLKLAADTEQKLGSVEFWLLGSFGAVTMRSALGIAPPILLGLGGTFLMRRRLFLLNLPDEEAVVLGVPVRRTRAAALLLAALLTGAVVSVTGIISFVGLLAPHIGRLTGKKENAGGVAFSGLVGGCLLLGADLLARSLTAGELPAGLLTSLLGGPALFLLLSGRRGSRE